MWRCDLDILFIIKKQSMLIPFSEVVDHMKKCLLKVDPRIVAQGQKNTNISGQYTSDQTKPPPHILKVVAREMGVDKASPEELTELRRTLIEERNQQIDEIQWDECTVTGRYHDMELHDDGTMIPLDTTTMTEMIDGEPEYTRKSLRETMSFKELKEMFPTIPPRALRLYQQFTLSETNTPQERWTATFNNPSSSTNNNLNPRHLKSHGPSLPSHPSRNDIEPDHTLWTASQRQRESFRVNDPHAVHKRRQVHEAMESTPFNSSIRSTSNIPGFQNEDTTPGDETFDYLFGTETSTSSPPTTERHNRRSRSSAREKRDNFLGEEGSYLPHRSRRGTSGSNTDGSSGMYGRCPAPIDEDEE